MDFYYKCFKVVVQVTLYYIKSETLFTGQCRMISFCAATNLVGSANLFTPAQL